MHEGGSDGRSRISGFAFCDRLIDEGWDVLALDNLVTGVDSNVEHLLKHPNFRIARCDVSKYIDVPGPVDYVLHFASPASPVDYLKLPIQTLKVGALGTHNALGLALAKKAKFFLASTSECYGDPEISPQHEEYWGHVNPIGPRGVYDEAKRFAEAMTMAYHRYHGVDTHIVRIFNTYGPRMRLNDGRALPNFVHQALTGKPTNRLWRWQADAKFLLCFRPDRRDLPLDAVGRTLAHEYRKSARNHDSGICGAGSRAFR